MKPAVDMELKREIAKRIKEIRKEHHLTQKEFAESIDISRVHVSYIESPTIETMPSKVLLKKICYIYNINFDWLMTGEGEKTVPSKSKALNKFLETDKILLEQTVEYFKLRSSSLFSDIQKEDNDMPEYFKFYNSGMNLILEITEALKAKNKKKLSDDEIMFFAGKFTNILKKH